MGVKSKQKFISQKSSTALCSKISTNYKRHAISGELNKAKRIPNHFNFEVKSFYQLVSLEILSENTTEYLNKTEI